MGIGFHLQKHITSEKYGTPYYITLENNLAYIDPNKCKSCRKCVEVCPQNTIIELNFPPRKPKAEEAPKTVAAEAPKVTE